MEVNKLDVLFSHFLSEKTLMNHLFIAINNSNIYRSLNIYIKLIKIGSHMTIFSVKARQRNIFTTESKAEFHGKNVMLYMWWDRVCIIYLEFL